MLLEEKFDLVLFRDIVNEIFSTDDRDKANTINNNYKKFLDTIIGTRGNTGKKMTNSSTFYNLNFIED